MTREQFWALVEQTLRDAEVLRPPRRGLLRREVVLRPGERHVLALEQRLAALSDDDLAAFQAHLDALRDEAYDWGVWGAGYVACGGMSDDSFTDFRTWLVSQGRAAYERVLADPDALALVAPPDLDDRVGDAEGWGYVALEVWDGRRPDEMPRPAFGAGAEPRGEPFPEDDADALARRYPRLSARSGA
ncbi:MAG: hypothetical protein JWN17_841 [Frankiales bacterium]|nr:hypothetical protein [Frankiales bacterium]